MTENRWAPFSDDELWEIWVGLTIDDGIQYGIDDEDRLTYKLCVEIFAEAKSRGMVTDRNRHQWEHGHALPPEHGPAKR